jgi:hypothetical protein
MERSSVGRYQEASPSLQSVRQEFSSHVTEQLEGNNARYKEAVVECNTVILNESGGTERYREAAHRGTVAR